MSVINTTEGWALSASRELVKELNNLGYQKDSIHVHCCDDENQIKQVNSNNVTSTTNMLVMI